MFIYTLWQRNTLNAPYKGRSMSQNILTGLILQKKNEPTTLTENSFLSGKHIHTPHSQLRNKKSPAFAWAH
jgi:hypothetical protein